MYSAADSAVRLGAGDVAEGVFRQVVRRQWRGSC